MSNSVGDNLSSDHNMAVDEWQAHDAEDSSSDEEVWHNLILTFILIMIFI
jgi:hypothetical protein